jgi:hypothetical protein
MDISQVAVKPASTVLDGCDYTNVDPRRVRERLRHHLRDLSTRVEVEPAPLHPIFVERRSYEDVLEGTLTVLRLAQQVVNQLLGSGIPAASEALGIDESYVRLMSDTGDVERAAMGVMARPDVILTEDGPKIIELNAGGSFGGVVEYQCLLQAWKEIYPGADWDVMSPVDPVGQRARFLVDAFRASGARDLCMIGEMADHKGSSTSRYCDLDLEAVRALGPSIELVGAQEAGAMARRGRAGAVLAFSNFSPAEWRKRGVELGEIEQFVRAGGRLLPSMLSILLNSKTVLAYLSAGTGLSPQDTAPVAKYVPWTRIVSTGQAEAAICVEEVLQNQDSLILKKSLSLRSEDVFVGRYSSQAQWRAVADRAARGGWIAQQWMEPVLMSMNVAEQGTDTVAAKKIRCVLSPIVINGQSRAVYGRYRIGDPEGGIINAGSAGAMENMVVPLGSL